MRARLGLIALLTLSLAGAQTPSQKLQDLQRQLQSQRQLSEAQQQRLKQLRRDLAALDAQQKQALARLDQLGASIADLQRQSGDLADRVAGVRAAVADLDGRVAVSTARTERLKANVRALMLSLYKERGGRYLELLSQAKSLSDVVIGGRYADMLGRQNVELIRDLKSETARLNTLRDQQLSLQAQLDGLQVQLQGKLADVRSRQVEQQATLKDLQRTQQGRQALALQTRAQQQVTANTIDSLLSGIVAERARLEAERQARLAAERARRAEEARKLREAQEKLRQERARLARLEAQRQAAQRQAAQDQQAQTARQNVEREQRAVTARQQQLQQQDDQAETQAAPLPGSVGQLSLPLAGGRVSVPYGREGPWTVLSAAPGAEVRAAADGQVLTETANANEGWTLIVAHTPTLYTVYSGLQQPSVPSQARVSRGQTLGFVGGSPLLGADSLRFRVVVSAGGAFRYISPNF